MPFAPVPVTTEDLKTYLSGKHGNEVTFQQLVAAADHFDCSVATVKKRLKQYKKGIGKWDLTLTEKKETLEKSYKATPVQDRLIPTKDNNFVPFGNFSDLKKIIKSKVFYPAFITGLSGNGKTMGVEQACAALNRELIRVNITIETDEDDLIGGFRLVDGNTVWHNGPVIEALERGAVLLLDEIDLASNKILCLQSILEGSGVFLKKIGRYVKPAKGFTVIATANTKGKGSDDGRFIGTNVLNEAFLERFPLTFEQEYPTPAIETKMLNNYCKELDACDDKYIANLVTWADMIRRTFREGGVDEVISTRRLVHIIRAYAIFSDRAKAIKVCLNRFDDETKQSFLDLYDKIDGEVDMSQVETLFNS
ncbi:AAA and cbbQ type domains containing protein [Cyanophage P-TIM40]|uniref:AAA and cbbQ type domains containing protein n=1 Tax=Cyanophage P-TIM40 TaxID=1589733 RepID=A0A0C5AIU7_9CAUD|nr:porphyrin biosynthesis [Cyanophage P-TIM40]AJK27578.1 AAA and cbbQ type domains containing protein [Cyanophage P-TIM40]|tara:strand:- start:3344 stop:4438 length:1095 start_codon:yes stop_codon:yes gene_type:complete